MPSIPSKPDLSNLEQDMMILNDSKEESPDLVPEINSMNEKVLLSNVEQVSRGFVATGSPKSVIYIISVDDVLSCREY